MSTNGHKWNPRGYEEHAHYVYKLGEPLIALLSPAEGEKILDLGCGHGELTLRLSEFECDVVGIDASEDMVHAALENGVNAVVMNAEEMTFDNEFDGIISNAAIHWMNDIKKVVDGYTHLSATEKAKLMILLYQYEDLFNGTLGDWKTEPVNIKLKPG